MNQDELQKLVETISLSFFQRPFHHNARFNQRLRTTGGRYLLHSHDIEINPKQYDVHGIDALVGIIKHELCHYHLHLQNKGFRHRDKDFQELLKRVGGSRYCRPIEGTKRTETVKYRYECVTCGQAYKRKRRVDTSRFVCGKCGGKLLLKQESLGISP